MSEAATKMPYHKAKMLADRIVHVFTPACERIEIAGSVRRMKAECGDVEIVVIPKRSGLFEAPEELEAIIQRKVDEGKLHRIKAGDKYKQFSMPHERCKLDLFIVEPEAWGVQFTIRTGPADFSRRIVTQQVKGGLLPNDLRVEGGCLWRGDELIPTPEEADFFLAAELEWIEPKDRV